MLLRASRSRPLLLRIVAHWDGLLPGFNAPNNSALLNPWDVPMISLAQFNTAAASVSTPCRGSAPGAVASVRGRGVSSLMHGARQFCGEGLRTDIGPISEAQFHKLADHTLEDLVDRIEAFVEDVDVEDSDVAYSQGVLTVKLGGLGTYVLNKQTPNRQIWMSSPVSGPVRYDYKEGGWVYHRDGHSMHERLEAELEQLTGTALDLNPCSTCERLSVCMEGTLCPK